MENNLPDWFNTEEFDKYLSEDYYGAKAYRDTMMIWGRAKRDAANLIASTPLNKMAHAQKVKASIEARAAKAVARKIQVAKEMDAQISAARNPIPQTMLTQGDNLDDLFVDFLTEAAKKGSQREMNTGTKESPTERARQRNITGDAKKQARYKKQEQRKDQKRPVKNANPKSQKQNREIGGVLKSGGTKDPGNFIGVRLKKGKERGVIEIIPKADYDPDVHEVIVGSANKGGRRATLGELSRLASEEKFQATRSSKFLGISREKQVKEKPKKKEDNKKAGVKKVGSKKETESKQAKEEKTKKPVKSETVKEKPKKANKKPKTEKEKQNQSSPQQAQMQLGNMPLSMTQQKLPKAKLAIPQYNGSPVKVSFSTAEAATVVSQLASTRDGNDILELLLGGKKRDASDKLNSYQELLDQYPQLVDVGNNQLQMMLQHLASYDPVFAELMDEVGSEELLNKFIVVPSKLLRNCLTNSKFYKQFGAKDTTPKADILVISVKYAKSIVEKSLSKKCNYTKDELESIKGFSLKQGETAQITSSQVKESLAVVEAVAKTIDDLMNNPKTRAMIQKALMSGGGESSEYLVNIRKLIEGLKDLISLTTQKEYFDGRVNYSDLQDPMKRNIEFTKNPAAAAKLVQIEAKQKQISEIVDDLFNNPIIKALIIHEQLTGQSKFGDEDTAQDISSVFGSSNNVLMMDEQGFAVSAMAIPSKEMLLEGPQAEDYTVRQFYMFTRKQRIRASMKPRRVQEGKPGEKTRMEPVTRVAAEEVDLFVKNLDTLFETQFEPYDREIVTTTSQLTIDPADDISKEMDQVDDQQDEQNALIPFNGMTPEEFAKAVSYNFIRIVQGAGFDITDINVTPFNAAETGMMLSSMNSGVFNTVTYNGREFQIPVIPNNMTEEFIEEYNKLNDEYVEMIKNGKNLDEAIEEFQNVLLERDYKREYRLYHSKPKHRKERSRRVLARRKMVKKHGKKALQGKDIDHKDGNAMNNGDSNLRVRSINSNRADNKHRKGEIKEQVSKKPNWLNKLTGSWEYTEFLMNAVPGQKNIDKGLKDLLSSNKGKSR